MAHTSSFLDYINKLTNDKRKAEPPKLITKQSPRPSGLNIHRAEIISVAREYDVVGWRLAWMLERIESGYIEVLNPQESRSLLSSATSRLSLSPKDVRCIVWWSKDFANWLEHYKADDWRLKQYDLHLFNFTLNPECNDLEPNIRTSLDGRLKQLRYICKTPSLGPDCVNLRIGPILQYGKAGEINAQTNMKNVKLILEYAYDLGIRDVTFSFCSFDDKIKERMKDRNLELIPLNLDDKKWTMYELSSMVNGIAKKSVDQQSIQLCACCEESGVYDYPAVRHASCVDAHKINQIFSARQKPALTKVSSKKELLRPGCNCNYSVDLSDCFAAQECDHGCLYCLWKPKILDIDGFVNIDF